MVDSTMHADETPVDAELARALIAAEFPQWADLPLARVAGGGTDNAIFRLGNELVVRLPRLASSAQQVGKELRWLPRLAPHLPLHVPEPVAAGSPGHDYPWPWGVYRWIAGTDATVAAADDPHAAAVDLARFVTALQGVDPAGGPGPGTHNSFRGASLQRRDPAVRAAIAALEGTIDTVAAAAAWEAALAAPPWEGRPMWLHGDLIPSNLLVAGGRLDAVIDFGCLGVGDPACDTIPAWTYLSGDARAAFRAELGCDDATWARGRGWAVSFGLIALPYYRDSNPILAGIARHAIDEVLADHRGTG